MPCLLVVRWELTAFLRSGGAPRTAVHVVGPGGCPIGLRMQPRNEKFFPFAGKARTPSSAPPFSRRSSRHASAGRSSPNGRPPSFTAAAAQIGRHPSEWPHAPIRHERKTGLLGQRWSSHLLQSLQRGHARAAAERSRILVKASSVESSASGSVCSTSRWWRWTHGRDAPLRPAGPRHQLEAMRHARAASHAGVPRSPQPQRVLAARSDCGTSRVGCDRRCRELVACADHPSRPPAAAPGTERRHSCNARTGNFRPCTHSAFHADRSAHRHSARCGPGGQGQSALVPESAW